MGAGLHGGVVVISGYSGFLSPPERFIWLIVDSKLTLGVSVDGCLSRASCPMTAGIGSNPPQTLSGIKGG